MAEDYATYIYERYEGEVYGEAMFRAMAEAATDPENARKLRVLEQLERETKEALLPEVEATGGQTRENSERLADANKIGAQFGSAPWLDMMKGMSVELEKYVAESQRCEALAPPGREALVKQVTAHEQALLDFARSEIAGADADESLAPVVALLRDAPAA